MKVLQILAFPLSLLYSLIMRLRNFLYDQNIFSSSTFSTPVISVGNLSLGGTGKSPHIEYLIELLSKTKNVATLSRGYGRSTKGFILVNEKSGFMNVGDEPLQFKKKYPPTTVAVCENRATGIKELLETNKSIDSILLDDAFQHRGVKPGLSILLTDYHKPFYNDLVIPSGTLREPRTGYKRADIVIVTKTPELMLDGEKENITRQINPLPHQRVYFSHITYGDFVPISPKAISHNKVIKEFFFDAEYSIVLFTGIANSTPLVEYLSSKAKEVQHLAFADHHSFSESDIKKVFRLFDNITNANKIILTTEKDAVRLKQSSVDTLISEKPIYYIPIKIEFEEKDRISFNKQVQEFCSR